MTRPIHNTIIQICATVEQQGAMTITSVRLAIPAADAESVRRHCNRAIGLRLLVIDRKACPFEYRVRAGWREKLGVKVPALAESRVASGVGRPAARVGRCVAAPAAPMARLVASVWDLGVLA